MPTKVHSRDSGGAHSLPAKYYISPEVFSYEQSIVFPGHWICVGHVSEFVDAGSFKTLTIGSDSIVVARDQENRLNAFYNVCRHRGTLVEERESGVLENNCLVCPYHAWRYDLSGALVSAPNMQNVIDFCNADYSLAPVELCESFGFVFVRLATDNSFADHYLEPLQTILEPWNIPSLVRCGELNYQVAANWKLLFLNYSECYHCPIIHSALSKLTPYKSATNEMTSGPVLGGPMNLKDNVASLTETGESIGPACAGLNQTQRNEVRFFTVFPNMFVSPHPDYVMVHRIEPISAAQTKVACEFYVPEETMLLEGFSIEPAKTLWDETNREDWHVSELAQKGISSRGYIPGPYSNLESVLAEFDRYYMNCMCGFENGNGVSRTER